MPTNGNGKKKSGRTAKGVAMRAYKNRRKIAGRVKAGAGIAKKGVRQYRRYTGARAPAKKK